MIIKDLKQCIKDGTHNSKLFTSAMPYGRFCKYCMTEIEEENIVKKGKLKVYDVCIDYPSEIMSVKARSKSEAENKALKLLGIVEFNALKVCTAIAEEVK